MNFEFGNELMILRGDTIECPSKKAYVLLSEVENFMENRQKRAVGVRGDTNMPCFMWEDDHYVHIGCLKEMKDVFQEKYAQLILNLNRCQ